MQRRVIICFALGLLAANVPAYGIRTGRLTAGSGSEVSLAESGLQNLQSSREGVLSSSKPTPLEGCFRPVDTGSTAPEIKTQHVGGETLEKAVTACQDLCRKEPNCTHFTINNATRVCYVKKGNPKWYTHRGDLTATRDCLLHKSNECYFPHNTGSVSSDLKVQELTAETPAKAMLKCQFLCRSVPDCSHFTYSASSNKCHLKTRTAHWSKNEKDMSATRDCVFGLDNGCFYEKGSRSPELKRKSLSEGFPYPDMQVKECQRLCQVEQKCTHFTYNLLSKTCYLKHGNPQWYDYKGDVSATNSCSLDFERLCYNTHDAGSQGKEIATKRIDSGSAGRSFRECQKSCQSMENCTHFTYNKDSKLCFLKNGDRWMYDRKGDMTATRTCEWLRFFA